MKSRRIVGGLGVILACWAATGWSPARATDTAVVEGAKKEGLVMVYSGQPREIETLAAAFNKKYPTIKVEFYESPIWQLYERYKTEYRAKRNIMDILYVSVAPLVKLRDEGLLVEYASPELAGYVTESLAPSHLWANVKPFVAFPTVNSVAFPRKDLYPKDWPDFASPKPEWTGKMSVFDPRSSGVAYDVLYALSQKFGDDMTRKIYEGLRKAKARIGPSTTDGMQAAVTGEQPIMFYILQNHWAGAAIEKKAPLEVLIPKSGPVVSYAAAGIVKTAPHPNAARLFSDFMLSEEGQRVFAGMHMYALRKGIPPPKGLPELHAIPTIQFDPVKALARQKALTKLWVEAVGAE